VSIQPGGELDELNVGGSLIAERDGVTTLQVHGAIHRLTVGGNVVSDGNGSRPISVDGGSVDVTGIGRQPRQIRR
jgi:hypothetical protein